MIAVVLTAAGAFCVDLETEEVGPWTQGLGPQDVIELRLPRLVTAAAAGATIYAVVDTRPPLAVSHDAGVTWRESGRGLPPGRDVAALANDPDVAVYAARNRLYVTLDGGRFWRALAAELPEIERVEVRD